MFDVHATHVVPVLNLQQSLRSTCNAYEKHAHLQVNAFDKCNSQKSLVLVGQVLLGHSQRHVGLLGPRHVASSCLAGCSEGDVVHLHKDGAPVRLQMHFHLDHMCKRQLDH